MAYRELVVIEIREVLRRFCLGEGLRAIARGIGGDRKTVAKYVAAAGLRRDDPGPTDEHVAAVLTAARAIVGGRHGQVPDRLTAHREQIATWLAEASPADEDPPGPRRGRRHRAGQLVQAAFDSVERTFSE